MKKNKTKDSRPFSERHPRWNLAEITVDGKISDDERDDFLKIKKQLDEISLLADTLSLWFKENGEKI